MWFKPVGHELVSAKKPILGKIMYIGQTIIFILFINGFIKTFNKNLFPVVVMFIYFAIMHNLITPVTRYRIPIEWFMLMFSCYGIFGFFRKWIYQ